MQEKRIRRYKELTPTVHLLTEGVKYLTKTRGILRVISNGTARKDNGFSVLFWNTRNGNQFRRNLTERQLVKALRNDGIL